MFGYNPDMPRRPRNAPGGTIYHVLDRGVGPQTLFHKPPAGSWVVAPSTSAAIARPKNGTGLIVKQLSVSDSLSRWNYRRQNQTCPVFCARP